MKKRSGWDLFIKSSISLNRGSLNRVLSVHTTTHLKRLDGPFSTSLKMKAYKPTRLRCQSPIDAEKIESPKAKHQKK